MSLFTFVLRLKGFNLSRARKWLALDQNKEERLENIVSFHLKYNDFYRSIVGDKEIKKISDLPILTKSDFQHPLHEIVTKGFKNRDLYISNTSGSSGHPFFFAKDKLSHAITHEIIIRQYAQWGITTRSKQARFYGIPLRGFSLYKEKLKDLLSNRVRFPIFDLSENVLRSFLEKFSKNRFDYIYGYTSAILIFSKFLLKNHIVLNKVCPTLKCCIVTSEMCTEEDKKVIEEALGIVVVNEYGCSETSIIAFTDTMNRWRLIDDNSYYELVDEKGNTVPMGTEGRILITSLSNKAMPFIRYEVGDLGVFEKDEKEDIILLKKLTGRVSDLIHLPSGKVAGGLAFYYISRAVMENGNFIKEFIVRQVSLDTFVFDLVSDRDLTQLEIESLQLQMNTYLEPGLHLIINRVEKIIRPESGKIKHFYSEI